MSISYTEVLYKYLLTEKASAYVGFAPPEDIITPFIKFYKSSLMVLEKGYASDGPSGPTFDDETNMQASFFHDGGYQLMRLGLLDEEVYRPLFDELLYRVCKLDGMPEVRADYYYEGVKTFGDRYAKPTAAKVVRVGKDIDFRQSVY